MSVINIVKILGENNQVSPEKMDTKEIGEDGISIAPYLSDSMNVELDLEGIPRMVEGFTELLQGDISDIWSDGDVTLYRQGTSLKQLLPDESIITHVQNLGSDNYLSYVSVDGIVYYSNGNITGQIYHNEKRNWGVIRPIYSPTVTVNTVGDMSEGTYLITVCYTDSYGRESGASPFTKVTLTNKGSLVISPAKTLNELSPYGIIKINVYCSNVNGELPFLAGTIEGNEITMLINQDNFTINHPLKTKYLSNPPAGQILQYFNARILIAAENLLWFTEPYLYEYVNRSRGFIDMSEEITFVGPTASGVYVSTTKGVYYLFGDNIYESQNRMVLSDGAIKGCNTSFDANLYSPDIAGNAWAFLTEKGLYYGFDQGQIKAVTEQTYHFPVGSRGYMQLKESRGETHLLIGLRDNQGIKSKYE